MAPFAEEPFLLIHDQAGRIQNAENQLRPFGSMIKLSHTENVFNETLQQYPRNILFILLLSSVRNEAFLLDFIRRNLSPPSRVRTIFCLFPNGYAHRNHYQAELGDKFGWCRSSEQGWHRSVLDAGRRVCHERINFCEALAREYEFNIQNNDETTVPSMLNLVYNEKKRCADLMTEYFRSWNDEID